MAEKLRLEPGRGASLPPASSSCPNWLSQGRLQAPLRITESLIASDPTSSTRCGECWWFCSRGHL